MRIFRNECLNCDDYCIGNICPLRKVLVHYCDNCYDRKARFVIDGEELCEKCASELLTEEFEDMSIEEKADALGFRVEVI